jgi:hypothetical protein
MLSQEIRVSFPNAAQGIVGARPVVSRTMKPKLKINGVKNASISFFIITEGH